MTVSKLITSCTLKAATAEEKDTLSNLLQLYIYDFTEFIDAHVEANGLFKEYPLEEYFQNEKHFPYLIESQGRWIGLALVKLVEENQNELFVMAEFFIMKKYRQSGIGKRVAHQLFDLHIGQWKVSQIAANKPAQSFWLKVIGDYTDGDYDLSDVDGYKTLTFQS